MEKCHNCEANIGNLEVPYVFKGDVVCQRCYDVLSQPSNRLQREHCQVHPPKNLVASTLIVMTTVIVTLAVIGGIIWTIREAAKEITIAYEAPFQITQSNLETFKRGVKRFKIDNYRLPTESEGLVILYKNHYLRTGLSEDDCEPPVDAWGNEFVYTIDPNYGSFEIKSFGPDGKDGGGDDITVWGI